MIDRLYLTEKVEKLLRADPGFQNAVNVYKQGNTLDESTNSIFYYGIEFVPADEKEIPAFFELLETGAQTFSEYLLLYEHAYNKIEGVIALRNKQV